ncbi:MAG: hypothetical protein MUD12_04815 [Spirochaetes bacterium]|jgi:hypothetical protein|nr:hypothetical protein [Spirochaetota bacterium]
MKQKYIFFIFLSVALLPLPGCKTTSIIQSYMDKNKVLVKAYKAGKPVAIKFSDSSGSFIIKEYSGDEEYARLLISDKSTGKIYKRISDSIRFAYPLDEEGTIVNYSFKGTNLVIKCRVKSIEGDTIQITSEKKFEVNMPDDSELFGIITGIELMTGDIYLTSKIMTYRIPVNKIIRIRESSNDVKVVLIDGTQRSGILVSDSNNLIVIKTILGEEKYPRNTVNRIEYK